MTQSPPPYPYPPQSYPPYGTSPTHRASALRAGTLTIIVGALLLLLGGCMAVAMAVAPAQILQDAINQQQVPISAEVYRIVLGVVSGVIAVIGVALIVIGIFVLRGSVVMAIIGAVICGLIGAYLAFNTIFIVLQGGALQAAISLIPAGISGLTAYWLIGAARDARAAAQLQQTMPAGYPPPQPGYPPAYSPYGQPMQGYYATATASSPQPQQTQQPAPPPNDQGNAGSA